MKMLFLIPGMAIFVLGISFTNLASATEVQPEVFANDYVYVNGNWIAIPEQNCSGGKETCRVQFGIDGPIYDVYDEEDLITKKTESNGVVVVLYQD